MKIAAFIYARYTSKRLPGKALLNIGNKPLIEHVIDNLHFLPSEIPRVLLTSNKEEDEPLIDLAKKKKILWHRGSLENVALRTVGAISKLKPDYFIRVNGDCPIQLRELFEEGMQNYSDYDLISNIIQRTYNYGISFEMIKSKAFLKHCKNFSDNEKEHITSFFYNNINLFKVRAITTNENYYPKGPKFTVDSYQDISFINKTLLTIPDISGLTIKELNTKTKML